jgi:hypothetical protein
MLLPACWVEFKVDHRHQIISYGNPMLKKVRRRWHRLAGLILESLFERLGYETKIEYDISRKQQFVDLVVVRKKELKYQAYNLPRSYWYGFEQLNEYNLISFKSYSESFNKYSLFELLGHYIAYLKIDVTIQ